MPNVSALLVADLSRKVKTPSYDGLGGPFTSEKVKGDAQLRVSSGVHTVDISLFDFKGIVVLQGTLKSDPQEDDWVNISLTSPDPAEPATLNSIVCVDKTTKKYIYLLKGNFYWIRCVVDPLTFGSVNYIRLIF